MNTILKAQFNKRAVIWAWGCVGARKLISGVDTFIRAGGRPLLWQEGNGVCIGFVPQSSHLAVVCGCQGAQRPR